MSIKFTSPTRQGAITFAPGVALAFEDPLAEPYFIAAGWAQATDDEPAMTYVIGEIEIDPETVFGHGPNIGQPVMPAAQEA